MHDDIEVAQSAALQQLGEYALRYVRPGLTIGLGTGRAASAFIRALGRSGIKVRGVPTSEQSSSLARQVGIEIIQLSGKLDLTVDGADEVDPKLNMIKGYGGAMLREKIVASASKYYVILVGEEKLVEHLGEKGILPVEVLPFAVDFCIEKMTELGLKPKVRTTAAGEKVLTDNGNFILDCGLENPIEDPKQLERALKSIPGVLGTGLFIEMADEVAVCRKDGKIDTLKRQGKPGP